MLNGLYNIGEAAVASGVTAKMIRHYEEGGLIPKASRTQSGYRLYNDKDVHMLRFIRHARNLGFSIKRIEELLDLWRDQDRESKHVKALAMEHIRELDAKVDELLSMKSELQKLIDSCQGNNRPDCPIISRLALNEP